MIQKIINYFKSSYEELKKVIWPGRQQVKSHTVIVVLTIVIAMGVVTLLDLGLFNLMEILIYKN